jgi:hypothetical protein
MILLAKSEIDMIFVPHEPENQVCQCTGSCETDFASSIKTDEEPHPLPQCAPKPTVFYGANTWPRLCYNGADHELLSIGEAATPRNVGIVQWGAVLE